MEVFDRRRARDNQNIVRTLQQPRQRDLPRRRSEGGAWERLLARSIASVEFGLKHPGHYKVLFEGRVVPRLNDPSTANFGRPLLVRSIELIREIAPVPGSARVSDDPQRLALLLWSGLHRIVSLGVNKPTIEWPSAVELVEQIARAIVQPDVARKKGTRQRHV